MADPSIQSNNAGFYENLYEDIYVQVVCDFVLAALPNHFLTAFVQVGVTASCK